MRPPPLRVPEKPGVAEQQPGHCDQRDRDEAHHDHVEHAGGADHAAVEDGQARGHQQHQSGAGEQPGGGGGIDTLARATPNDPDENVGSAFQSRGKGVSGMFRVAAGLPRSHRWGPLPGVGTASRLR